MKTKNIFRDLIGFLISAVILTFYGAQVCPFLESLSSLTLFLVIVISFILGWAIRSAILLRLPFSENKLDLPWKVLWLDLATWTMVGLVVTFWNNLNYDFPIGSGLKIVLGCLSMGVFFSTYLSLETEYVIINNLAQSKAKVNFYKKDKFLSLATKFFIFISISIVFVTMILLLLIYKDFQFVIETLTEKKPFKFIWVAQEILFVFALLMIGSLTLARRYGRNLKLIFSLQLKSLDEVENGNLNTVVPVITHDELGIIGQHTNKMIEGLREKRRIKEIFGKYIGTTLANSILKSEEGTKLGGREVEICLLFTDIRNFTTISEQMDPCKLITHLNNYFSIIVSIIHQHNGVLDKFIGDAAMGIFGLDQREGMCIQAINAALKIQDELTNFNQEARQNNLPEFITGVGIHVGKAIAGNIGSKERLEYTVIGDTVNTASRIQDQTKTAGASILVSQDVFKSVDNNFQPTLKQLGNFPLKGKSENVILYTPAK